MPTPPRPHFGFEQGSEGSNRDVTVLRLMGEMDVVAGSEVSAAIRSNLAAGHSVKVDLTDVTFMDSSGLAAILLCVENEDQRGRVVVAPSLHRQPARLAALTGLEQFFQVEEKPAD